MLTGLPEKSISKLQVAQNNAAKVVERRKKRDHATPLLHNLHWLPVRERIQYKVATICFKCINGLVPMYLQEKLVFYTPNRTLRSSSDTSILKVPDHITTKYMGRAPSHTLDQKHGTHFIGNPLL